MAIEKQPNAECSSEVVTEIEAPHRSDLMIELIRKLKPQIVVTGIADFEAKNVHSF